MIALLDQGREAWNASQAERGPDSPVLDLRGLNLQGKDLSSFLFNVVDLSEANFRRCVFREARFSLVDLTGADLEGADLLRAGLIGVQFEEAKLRGVQLYSAHGEGTSFVGADLREADLRGVRFSFPHFHERRSFRRQHEECNCQRRRFS